MQSNLLIGNVVADPVLNTSKETPYTKLRIAVNSRKKEETLFVDIFYSGKTAEQICQYLTKGRLVSVTFNIKNNKYTKDGVEVHTFDFYGNDCVFLDRKENEDD
jgi:single-stranded DNA-binding protein